MDIDIYKRVMYFTLACTDMGAAFHPRKAAGVWGVEVRGMKVEFDPL
jgi:hypothetical protein